MKSLILLVPLLFTACAPKHEVKKDANGNEIPEPFVEVGGQATPTDTALFLAGRPVRHGAGLSAFQQRPEYRAYSRDCLQKWKLRASRRVGAQNAWQDLHIAPVTGPARTVIYPFGGPDLLYAMSVFPNASRYILLGLEPAGGLPDLESADELSVANALNRHAKSIESELLYGYFITKDMKTDFSNGPLQGVTPILLTSLGLMNAEITGIQSTSAAGNPAIEINFNLPGRGRKSMIYVSGDLSNGKFGGAFSSWLSSSASGSVAYFKAASYLMQSSSFSSVRSWVLGNCHAVVQDDSGIPYAAFDKQAWDFHLFGNYHAPIEFFAQHSQSDLKAAYDAAGPVPALTYGSGYQMKSGSANLMIAVRR